MDITPATRKAADMKSQVSALLHVLRGIHLDIQAAYPALRGDLSKDFERIARICQSRGLGVFALDLPHLESLLLRGLEEGRLVLEGPLSERKSKRTQVPRLYAGLWLRIFDERACLKHEVDPTALFFLRQVLVLGKKVEVECSYDRQQATVGAYHGIESGLRQPTLGWTSDDLGICGNERVPTDLCDRNFHLYGGDLGNYCVPFGPSTYVERLRGNQSHGFASTGTDPMSLHLVQAWDRSQDTVSSTLPLFHSLEGGSEEERLQRLEDQWTLNRIQQVADLVCNAFERFDPIFQSGKLEMSARGVGFKHGPGAVAERRKNWEKSQFVNWPQKLENTFPFWMCGTYRTSGQERPLNHEVASRLIAVPKTMKSPRLIAAEPTAHQWCQQLVLSYFVEQCRRHIGDFVDFRDQEKSGDLVLQASLDRKLATVDLSDASDRLTCWTVERMFRANSSILTALHAARTRYLRDEISEDEGFLLLRKFASQGTATTFPVMSLVMFFIAMGCSIPDDEEITWHSIRKMVNQVRVYGDDIILPTHGYGRLIRAMTILQLKINLAKSFVNGHFRESCGTDGYMGYDVTPAKPVVLVVDSPASCQAVVDNTNNLFEKGLWHASTAMFDLIPARLRRGIRIVGRNDVGFGGVTSHCGGDESHLKTRWNSRLHRWEVRVWGLLNQTRKRHRDGELALLDFFASKHNHEHARIVSEYANHRKTRIGLQWEPINLDARHATSLEESKARLAELLLSKQRLRNDCA